MSTSEIELIDKSSISDTAQLQPKQKKLCCQKPQQNIIKCEVQIGGQSSLKTSNITNNRKYTILSLVPIVLYNQFKFFFNFFYLAITATQFIDVLKVGFLFTYIAPLSVVLIMTLLKEAYDDYKRFVRDKELNIMLYKCKEQNKTIQKKAGDLKIGDIIYLEAGMRVPADLVVLQSKDQELFVRTDLLDGETDWKVRKPLKITQEADQFNGFLEYESPSNQIYNFAGLYTQNNIRESINLENTLWTNCILATSSIAGVIIYTGKHTRCAMNSQQQTDQKIGKFDSEINQLSKALFCLMIILSFVLMWMKGFRNEWFIQWFRYILLLSSIIPISLRVNLDLSKTYFSSQINSVQGQTARNSTIPEELGRIAYILSDKTGTLTKNEMQIKKIVAEEKSYSIDQINPFIKMVQSKKSKKNIKYKELINAILVCNNIQIIDGEIQGQSPDEIALVRFVLEKTGYQINRLNRENILVIDNENNKENYTNLIGFPFSSDTKRMTIIFNRNDNYVIFTKGADSVIIPRVKQPYRSVISDECDQLAREGLRTLVFAYKEISHQEYLNYSTLYEQASTQLQDRQEKIKECQELIERDLDYLGVTGVEDKLQDDVQGTIESFKQAGIKVWMLTGDKTETAKCIGIAAGIKGSTQQVIEIKDEGDSIKLYDDLVKYSNDLNNVLLVDGNTLACLLNTYHSFFFQIASQATSVICCRCSPIQKAQVAQALKNCTTHRVLSIGDGGNDVPMIQNAHVGVGIKGKEGMQAALASDFSIESFQQLKGLLLWHGRNAYKRGSALSQFVIHRGLVISIIQFVFSSIFYLVPIPIYNGYLMLGYTTIYTCLPVFCLILDTDINYKKAMEFPQLYQTLLKGRSLNFKTFLIWVGISIYQGFLITALSFYFFEDSFINLVTITFSALIISELLNLYTTLHSVHIYMLISQVFTFAIYFVSIHFLNQYINTSAINKDFIIKVLILVGISWAPIHLLKCVIKLVFPQEEDKLMSSERNWVNVKQQI